MEGFRTAPGGGERECDNDGFGMGGGDCGLGGPMLNRVMGTQAEFPPYEPTGEEELSEGARELVRSVARQMAAEGFETVANLKLAGAALGVGGTLLLFVNRANGDMGSAAYASSSLGPSNVGYGYDTMLKGGMSVVT